MRKPKSLLQIPAVTKNRLVYNIHSVRFFADKIVISVVANIFVLEEVTR